MEKRIEKWESLRLEAQKFMPQEYCDTCWFVTTQCQGESSSQGHLGRYVYVDGHLIDPNHGKNDPTNNLHWNGHSSHSMIFNVRVPDGVTPNIDNVGDIVSIYSIDGGISSDASDYQIVTAISSSGGDEYPGWGWFATYNGHYSVHFTVLPTFEINQDRPNHS